MKIIIINNSNYHNLNRKLGKKQKNFFKSYKSAMNQQILIFALFLFLVAYTSEYIETSSLENDTRTDKNIKSMEVIIIFFS